MFIKRPTRLKTGSKKYSLIGNDGKVIRDPRIDQINQELAAGVSRDILELRMQAVLKSYKPARLPEELLSLSNERLVLRCHEAKIRKKPDLAYPDGLKQRLLSCAKAMGDISIESGSTEDLYACTSKIKDRSRRFEVIRGINELLKYAGRAERLYNPTPKASSRVSFITVKDFVTKSQSLTEEARAVFGALFASSCRWGELPMAMPIGDKQLLVAEQLDDVGVVRATKNKKERHTLVLRPLSQYLKQYLALPQGEKDRIRLSSYNHYYRLCKKSLGIRIHDLRHSYAVALRAAGIATSSIADFIGDTEKVAKERYLRHGASTEEIEHLWKRFGDE